VKRILVIGAFYTTILLGCKNSAVVDTFEPIANQEWRYLDTVVVQVPIEDTSKLYNIFLNVRHTGAYAYRNLYVRMHLYSPSGESGKQTVSFNLADPAGKWLGKGLGDLYESKVLWREAAKFASAGQYQVVIEQFMREDPLPGISDIGLLVEYAEDIEQ
jgi:gliding motility-associated lipoprotein GldH